MHWLGLDGRAFVLQVVGFGCNVPAILGTRVIRDRGMRLIFRHAYPHPLSVNGGGADPGGPQSPVRVALHRLAPGAGVGGIVCGVSGGATAGGGALGRSRADLGHVQDAAGLTTPQHGHHVAGVQAEGNQPLAHHRIEGQGFGALRQALRRAGQIGSAVGGPIGRSGGEQRARTGGSA